MVLAVPLLKEISLKPLAPEHSAHYPFCVPVVRGLENLRFENPVTILVGENGTGKSTLLEALAVAAQSSAIGGESLDRDPTLASARELAKFLRLSWSKRTRKGFFLRSEDFFNFARRMKREHEELEELAGEFKGKYKGYAQKLAMGAALGQASALESRYGKDLDANSHGESFLKLFGGRLTGDGLFILDEPEAPLSPLRQIALIAMLQDCVKEGSQFVIATHAPILMGYPGAAILRLSEGRFEPCAFEELEHVKITKAFLRNPEAFLRHL